MPKQAVISNPVGQRAAVAALMLLLLGAMSALAYAKTLRPGMTVNVAGLAATFSADWRHLEGGDAERDRSRFILENERRPALRTVIRPLRAVDNQGEGIAIDAEALLRQWFPMMVLAPLPEDDRIQTRDVRGLDVAYWTGVLKSRMPIFGQSTLSVATVALVTDDDGRIWSIIIRDDNYRHEDPAERVLEHRARSLEVLDTLRRTSPSEVAP